MVSCRLIIPQALHEDCNNQMHGLMYVMHLQGSGVAAAASIAVEKVLPSPHTADAAGLAVKLLLRQVIIKEAALHAGVGTKRGITSGTVWPCRLAK